MNRLARRVLAWFAFTLAALPASAAFHLWSINEIYSNADGTVQFIELVDLSPFGGQQFVSGHAITASSGVTTHTYNVMTNLPGDSLGKRFLFGTAGFAAIANVQPDYIIPDNFLFPGGGTINWAGFDIWNHVALPTDPQLSLNRSGATLSNSPTNFAGTTGHADPTGDADADGVPNIVEVVEGLSPNVKDNDIFAATTKGARLFAMQQYRDFLGREGDAGGITSWTNYVVGGGVRAAVTEGFFGSSEFQGTGSPVVRLYFAYFLRIPDYAGLTFWMNYFRTGHSLIEISNAFAGSQEFVDRYGALTNSAFVDLVYQNVLGRPADAGGKTFWLGQLNGGMTRGEMMTGFSESAEFQSTSFSEVYVTMMYVGMLKRAPDSGGFNFWTGYIGAGNSGQALINGFLVAPEYRNRFLP